MLKMTNKLEDNREESSVVPTKLILNTDNQNNINKQISKLLPNDFHKSQPMQSIREIRPNKEVLPQKIQLKSNYKQANNNIKLFNSNNLVDSSNMNFQESNSFEIRDYNKHNLEDEDFRQLQKREKIVRLFSNLTKKQH